MASVHLKVIDEESF